jgi:hypothetical protein
MAARTATEAQTIIRVIVISRIFQAGRAAS